VHHGYSGEIVPLVEYLVGRKSGRFQASDPSCYRGRKKFIDKFGRAMVADSMGDELERTGALQRQQQGQYQYHQQSLEEQERYHRQWQQEQSQSPSTPPSPAAIQDQPLDVLPYPTDGSLQSHSMNATDDEETTVLSRETRLKIQELKRLVYRYSQYHRNPGAVVSCIVYYCNNGDNTLLDEKLEQLRSVDAIGTY